MTIDAAALFVVQTAANFLNAALELAETVGLPVTSWRVGDPTITTFDHLAEVLAQREQISAQYAKSAFLSTSEDDWAEIHAREVYGVERGAAVPSTPTVTIENIGGGVHEINAGDMTVKCSATGATFHNTDSFTLTGVGTADDTHTFDLVADVEGSAGTVAADEVDEFVTTHLGLEIVSSTAGVGVDQQSIASLKEDCGDTLGALSPNGPPDAYESVARNEALTGVSTITRARATSDSPIGEVTVYVAGPSGAVDGASVTAAQDAIMRWANPISTTPTVVSASTVAIPITATITGDDIPAGFVALLSAALATEFATLPIGGEDGETLFRSRILAAFHRTLTLRGVTLTSPSADVEYDAGEVPTLGAVSIVEA